MTVALRSVTQAVVDHLDAALSVPVHLGERPSDVVPAVVVFPIAGGEWLRLLANGWDNARVPYQITCVHEGPEGVGWLADEVRAAMVGTLPSGVKHVDLETASGVRPDRDVDPTVWVSTPVYYLTV